MVLASQATTLLQFQLLYGTRRRPGRGQLLRPLISTTTRWFTEHRSLAVALVSAGLSVGSTVMAPLARWLITRFRLAHRHVGHRRPGMARGPPRRPARCATRRPGGVRRGPVATAAAGPDLTIGQVVRTPQFAAIALTHFACCAAHSGPIFHMVTHAIDRGVAPMAAATVLSAAGLASLSGKIGCGIFADRVGAKRTLVAGLLLQAVAISLYVFSGSLGSFYALGCYSALPTGA